MKIPISDHQRKPGMFETWRDSLPFLGFVFLVAAFLGSVLIQLLQWLFVHNLTLANLIEAVAK